MSRPFALITALSASLTVAAVTALAQTPRIANGQVTTRAAGSLPQVFRDAVAAQTDAGWIGYAVPMLEGDRTICCFDGGSVRGRSVDACCGVCRLEQGADRRSNENSSMTMRDEPPIKLEGPDTLVVLIRVLNRQVERVRVFSEGCALDAGGSTVLWLTGVEAAQSLALLEGLLDARSPGERKDQVVDGAVAAIALHREAGATAVLERLLAPARPVPVRSQATFWLGTARGARGLEILERVVKADPSAEVRKKAVFGISQSPERRATDVLIDTARAHADTAIRAEAVFWLSQKAGARAAGAIAERIEHDPDTEVKKKAVFALSQLPKDEGVPLLLQVARTHTNGAVRKQAIFWLGQSNDPRALEFFAEVLK